jgi:hypothetical protein
VTTQNQDFTWAKRDAPWWVKLRRAGTHIREAAISIGALLETKPWRVEPEPADQPQVVAYRLRIDRQPPADLLAIVGDAIHNLRSALDAAALGLAERHLNTLTPDQERATYFPICEDDAAFQKFANRTRKGIKIADLYGSKGIKALASVQPFSIGAEAEAMGVQWPSTRQDDLKGDPAYRLDVLWNVDKHRRLPGLVWFYQGMACFGEPGACRQVTPNRSVPAGGQILARHHFPSAEDLHSDIHAWGIDLTLSDDPFGFPAPLIPMLERWQQNLGGWVIPRMFQTAQTGGEPPLGIVGGWPYIEGS